MSIHALVFKLYCHKKLHRVFKVIFSIFTNIFCLWSLKVAIIFGGEGKKIELYCSIACGQSCVSANQNAAYMSCCANHEFAALWLAVCASHLSANCTNLGVMFVCWSEEKKMHCNITKTYKRFFLFFTLLANNNMDGQLQKKGGFWYFTVRVNDGQMYEKNGKWVYQNCCNYINTKCKYYARQITF